MWFARFDVKTVDKGETCKNELVVIYMLGARVAFGSVHDENV